MPDTPTTPTTPETSPEVTTPTNPTLLARLKLRIPEAKPEDDPLLSSILDEAAGFIMAYTGRKTLPVCLEVTQLQLAVIYYNRLGDEGDHQRTEGGVSRSFASVPAQITDQLVNYRLAKVGFA